MPATRNCEKWCERCQRSFKNIDAHYDASKKHNQCQTCPGNLDFLTRKELQEHYRASPETHHQCKRCHVYFASRYHCENHIGTKNRCHKSNDNFCRICEENDQRYHKDSSDYFDREPSVEYAPLKCQQCNMSFRMVEMYMDHQESSTHSKPIIKCPFYSDCHKKLSTVWQVFQHMYANCEDNYDDYLDEVADKLISDNMALNADPEGKWKDGIKCINARNCGSGDFPSITQFLKHAEEDGCSGSTKETAKVAYDYMKGVQKQIAKDRW